MIGETGRCPFYAPGIVKVGDCLSYQVGSETLIYIFFNMC